MAERTRRGTARDRLIDTTAEVIYRHGVTASGVDTIAAAATVSKPTLYTHFRSKSDLITAALTRRHETRRDELGAYLEGLADRPADERILAVFDWLADWHRDAGARGCAFLNAAAELVEAGDAAARRVVREHKRWWAKTFAKLGRQAGATDPDRLGERLVLIMDGANARVLVEADTAPFATARELAELALAAETAPPARSAGTGTTARAAQGREELEHATRPEARKAAEPAETARAAQGREAGGDAATGVR